MPILGKVNDLEEKAFFNAILANESDDLPRLAYCDWLEERNDPTGWAAARAEFIRLDIKKYRLLNKSNEEFKLEYQGLGAKQRQLKRIQNKLEVNKLLDRLSFIFREFIDKFGDENIGKIRKAWINKDDLIYLVCQTGKYKYVRGFLLRTHNGHEPGKGSSRIIFSEPTRYRNTIEK